MHFRLGPKTKWLIGVLVAVLSLVAAALPAYWSWLCRSQGQFCERSAFPLRNDVASTNTINRRLQSKGGRQQFRGISVREAGYWPFENRYDVVASFANGDERVIDSVSIDRVDDIVDVIDGPAFLYASSTEAEHAFIRGYFADTKIVKRQFQFHSYDYKRGFIMLSNLAFENTNTRLKLDISTNASFEINNNKFIRVDKYYPGDIKGITLYLDLDRTFHIEKAYTRAILDRYTQSQKSYAACIENAKDNATKDGELFHCYRSQLELSGDNFSATEILEWRATDRELNPVDRVLCNQSGQARKDDTGRRIVVSCNNKFRGQNETSSTLSIYAPPVRQEKTLFFGGSCRNIVIFDAKFVDDYTIDMELTTECNSLEINNQAFSVPTMLASQSAVEPNGDRERTESYRLKLNDRWQPVSFKPRAELIKP